MYEEIKKQLEQVSDRDFISLMGEVVRTRNIEMVCFVTVGEDKEALTGLGGVLISASSHGVYGTVKRGVEQLMRKGSDPASQKAGAAILLACMEVGVRVAKDDEENLQSSSSSLH